MTNFMSVGSAPLTLEYDKSKSTLVSAANGSGKSSIMLDSICFALYGKPYRNINKPQLLNAVNQKALMVELAFKVDKTKYTIKRGIKPAVFEIYKNDKLLNQDAASRDYQKVLEQTILKMNYRTFTQVVIMGTGNYVPFMRLSPAARREFIEDILDIKIFSVMNALLKIQIKDHQEKVKDLINKIDFAKEKILMQKSFIEKLESEKSEKADQLNAEIDKLKSDIDSYWCEIEQLQLGIDGMMIDIADNDKITQKRVELMSIARQIKSNIAKQDEAQEFYTKIEVCPTCHQEIEEHHRDKLIGRAKSKIVEFEEGLSEISTKLDEFNSQLTVMAERQTEISELQSKISDKQNAITLANKLMSKHQKDVELLKTDTTSIAPEQEKLKKLSKDLITMVDTKKDLKATESYYDLISGMLKDTGIKTRIIKQYVPIFNKLINKYLQQLDLFVEFQLDENFNETVKSRYRDSFTYDSFSEGEKQRIDLALMFVFREVARLKNAINTNLLIMDEVLDASMDAAGVDNFFNIINGLSSTNLFIISHREGVVDKFDSNIRLIKKGNFTVLDS
jgi:DNA repair exonuclease SbcCD ATPase subunit